MQWCRGGLIFCAVFFVVRAGGFADELPTVAALNAKVDAVAGKRPPASYQVTRYTVSGVQGTTTLVRDGDNFRENDTLGPLVTAEGVYNGDRWHQNENGQTVYDAPDPGLALEEGYVEKVSRVSTPLESLVISRLNAVGNGTKEYVDPLTYRVLRREWIRAGETTVYAYDDFRSTAGYTLAWHWTVRDGHPEDDSEYTIAEFTVRPVDAGELAIASPRRALIEFPAGETTVELPARMVGDKFIVRVHIEGRGLDFLLDTGCAGISLEQSVAKQLGFPNVATFSNVDAARYREGVIVVPEMRVGELRMHDVVVSSDPLPDEDFADVKVVGLLGFDFIAELGLQLDYERGRVRAFQTDNLAVSDPAAIQLDTRLASEQPMTGVRINGALGERFLIDTGSAGALLIGDFFARHHPKALVDEGVGAGNDRQFFGIGGKFGTKPYELAEVELGNVKFKHFIGYRITDRTAYPGDVDGVIGPALLRYFTVWLDYGNSHVFLVPNGLGKQAMQTVKGRP